MAWKSTDVRRISETGQFLKLLTRTRQMYSDRSAASSELNALFLYPKHVMWLNITKRRRRYLIDSGYTLIRFPAARAAELRVKNGESEVDEGILHYGLTSSDVVPLVTIIPQTFCRGAQKKLITMLGEAMWGL